VNKAVEKRRQRAARAENMRRKRFIEAQLDGPMAIPDDDEWWDDMWLTTEDDTDSAGSNELSDE
jgi:hypothetical protein